MSDPGHGTITASTRHELVPVPSRDQPLYPNGRTRFVVPSEFAEFRALLRKHAGMVAIGSVLSAAIMCGAIAASAWAGAAGAVVMALGAGGAGVGLLHLAHGANARVWSTMFLQRGLVEGGSSRLGEMECVLPLLESAMSVEDVSSAVGDLRGFAAECGSFTIVESAGKHARFHSFQFAAFTIPARSAARHPSVSVRLRRLTAYDGARVDGEVISFESIAMNRALEVRIPSDADAVATRELFGPQLVAALSRNPVAWDQRGDLLLVFRDASHGDTRRFDEFTEAATHVARAYWMDQR